MSLESFLSWAGKPTTGWHIDVMKDNKLIQKIMIDEKDHYIFGRNPDLNSRYGTFIGKTKLEPNKPTQLQPDTQFSFGESTRYFILREKPVQLQISKKNDNSVTENETLPENEVELSNLTEFNTAHNKRISMIRVSDTEVVQRGNKRKKKEVNFKEEEDIINAYDFDNSIGKFSNLVKTTTIIPNKKHKQEHSFASTSSSSDSLRNMYDQKNSFLSESLSMKLNFNLPNSAPAVDFSTLNEKVTDKFTFATTNEPKFKGNEKKKYAKEVWPKNHHFT